MYDSIGRDPDTGDGYDDYLYPRNSPDGGSPGTTPPPDPNNPKPNNPNPQKPDEPVDPSAGGDRLFTFLGGPLGASGEVRSDLPRTAIWVRVAAVVAVVILLSFAAWQLFRKN